MVLAFLTKSLRDLAQDDERAIENFGVPLAKRFQARIADLIAASNPKELLAGNPRIAVIGDQECYIIDFSNDHEIIFKSNHQVAPQLESGKLDWSNVSRIMITEISQGE